MRERLDAVNDNYEFVLTAMGGLYLKDLDLPRGGSLAIMDSDAIAPDEPLLFPMPSSYFSRDPLASVGHGALLNRMYWPQRNREVLFYETILKHHPDYAGAPIWYDHNSAWHIEGGDVLNINAKTLAIGISQRTEAAAIDQLAKNLFWGHEESEIETIYAIRIPNGYAYMHLDTVCTQVDYDKFTVYPASIRLCAYIDSPGVLRQARLQLRKSTIRCSTFSRRRPVSITFSSSSAVAEIRLSFARTVERWFQHASRCTR